MAHEEGIEDIEIRLLLEAIYARYGYDLREYAPDSMRRRVLAALGKSGLAHLGELQHRLLQEPEFFAQVLSDLTVRVSDMFRTPSVYRAFRERVLPILRSYPLLRIWHAGCATGEEAYSSAIVLSEAGVYDRVQIYATDMSSEAIEHAKHGLYRADRLATFEENYRAAGGRNNFQRHATVAYDHIAMSESLRRNILFFHHNLVSDRVFGEMHVIFCRNVLIYFANPLRNRVLNTFVSSLCAGGFLCLGDSEQLSPPHKPHFNDFAPAERIFRLATVAPEAHP